jgi:hypothetical protein
MIALDSEDDLWRLFGGQNHSQPGQWRQTFEYVQNALQDTRAFHLHRPKRASGGEVAKAKRLIAQLFPLTDATRLYLLKGREREFVVDQARLLRVGKAMRDRELTVQYLGASNIGPSP